MEYNFPVTRTTHPKPRPADETKLGFAKYFTDHMFVMDLSLIHIWSSKKSSRRPSAARSSGVSCDRGAVPHASASGEGFHAVRGGGRKLPPAENYRKFFLTIAYFFAMIL